MIYSRNPATENRLNSGILWLKCIDYFAPPGKFEPVKWTCRAPLPSGRLCPRRDRFKCPLHGPVIARDNMGRPEDVVKRVREELKEEEERNRNPDWQNPQLLAVR